MKREIKFKAVRVDNGEWVCGSFINVPEEGDYIVKYSSGKVSSYQEFKVNPETVCQYAGLQDKHGDYIYEGDEINVLYNYIGLKNVMYENGAFNVRKYNLSKVQLTGKNIHDKNK